MYILYSSRPSREAPLISTAHQKLWDEEIGLIPVGDVAGIEIHMYVGMYIHIFSVGEAFPLHRFTLD